MSDGGKLTVLWRRYTQRSHWPDEHWVVPLVRFADEQGNIPQEGQFVPQCVLDRLAACEDMHDSEHHFFAPEHERLFCDVMENITPYRLSEILEAEREGRLVITPKPTGDLEKDAAKLKNDIERAAYNTVVEMLKSVSDVVAPEMEKALKPKDGENP